MSKVKHEISKSEIKYGRLSVRESDGTKKIFEGLPDRFTVRLKNKILLERQISKNRSVWIGSRIMRRFKVGEMVSMLRHENEITIK
jgi:hypothetical protein